MRSGREYDGGKAQSLVFTFSEHLPTGDGHSAPKPDFLEWLDSALYLDVAIAGDEAAYDANSSAERKAWQLYCNALEATGKLLDLCKADLALFRKAAGEMMLLPCFLSWHPDNQRFNDELLTGSQLARQNMESAAQPQPQHLARQSWPVQYAYAIIETIDLTMDTYEDRLPGWAEAYGYGVKHPIPESSYAQAADRRGWNEEKKRLELPKYQGNYHILPAWTKGLRKLRRPLNASHALDYWRVGKGMILEEMPDFHLEPEWASYRNKRAYHGQGGAKKGAIQHAIFKDIFAAVRTIAGAGKETSGKTSPKSQASK